MAALTCDVEVEEGTTGTRASSRPGDEDEGQEQNGKEDRKVDKPRAKAKSRGGRGGGKGAKGAGRGGGAGPAVDGQTRRCNDCEKTLEVSKFNPGQSKCIFCNNHRRAWLRYISVNGEEEEIKSQEFKSSNLHFQYYGELRSSDVDGATRVGTPHLLAVNRAG